MSAEKDASVLIIGAGIAGLSAGIALRKYGIEPIVFEQAPDVDKVQVGAGVSLGYNVARAFRHIDLLDDAMEVAVPIKHFQFITHKGKVLGRPPHIEGELSQGVLRPALHEFLVGKLGEECLQVGSKLERFEQDADGVTAHFADGRTARGDVLIGADGLHSAVRAQLLGPSEPRYAGFCARQGVVETDYAEQSIWQTALGRGQHFKSYPVAKRWMYWTAATNEPQGKKEKGAALKEAVLENFAGWPEPIEALVRETDDDRTYFAEAFDRDPVDRWGEGRVTLLGDAAHPMTWNRGQGASQGVEGGVLLAKQLAQAGDDPEAALRAWEAERIPRTGKIVTSSRQSGKIEQADGVLLCAFRNRAMSIMTSGKLFKRVNKDLLVEY
jgi:2-polyprenyl-6-methoxyphenol hydroxylase-like FAD-dependent oxidoreductase